MTTSWTATTTAPRTGWRKLPTEVKQHIISKYIQLLLPEPEEDADYETFSPLPDRSIKGTMKADILALVEVFGDSEVMVAQLKKEQTTQVRKAKDFTAKVNKKIEDGEEPWTFWQLHAEAEWAGEFGMWFGDLAKTLSEKVETCCARSINRLDL